jgi:hypothetical protein
LPAGSRSHGIEGASQFLGAGALPVLPRRYVFSVFRNFSLSPRGTSGGRVGEGGVRASVDDAPPLPGPLLPQGRRGRRDNGETLNTYASQGEAMTVVGFSPRGGNAKIRRRGATLEELDWLFGSGVAPRRAPFPLHHSVGSSPRLPSCSRSATSQKVRFAPASSNRKCALEGTAKYANHTKTSW